MSLTNWQYHNKLGTFTPHPTFCCSEAREVISLFMLAIFLLYMRRAYGPHLLVFVDKTRG